LADRHFLFVCSRNRWRSPTAEHLFADLPGVATLSAGTNPDAEEPLTDELVGWATTIFVMEAVHRRKVQARHRGALKDKPLVVLGIPDKYDCMDPALVPAARDQNAGLASVGPA
jgi:predicted protein tyrosine phosphatase